RALALAVVALALPASAAAAPFGELASLPSAPRPECLSATGAPGELVRWAANGAQLLRATPAGFAGAPLVALGGRPEGCPVAAARPDGAGVVAAPLTEGGIGVALRDPGGAWQPAQLIPESSDASVEDVAAAVSARGDAVVVWIEQSGDALRLRAARRS